MTKFLAAVVAAATLAGWGVTLQAEADPVNCDGEFPIFDSIAASEQENDNRISCVGERKQVIADRISERRERKADITERITELRNTKKQISTRIQRDKERAKPLGAVISLLSYVRGDVAWVWSTAACESGHDPEAHSSSGTYHGLGQFALHWKDDLDWFRRYGSDDPHTEPAIVQAAAMVELKREGGSQHWPTCG